MDMRLPSRVSVGLAALVAFAAFASPVAAAKTPSLGWSPAATLNYGTLDAATGGSSAKTFTLTNTDGKITGTITVSLQSGWVFSKTADGCTGKRLASKKSCSVTVTYTPTANGTDSATLSASAPGTMGASVALTGSSAWSVGDVTTYTQADWGGASGSTIDDVLKANMDAVYASSLGVLAVGLPEPNYSMGFTDPLAVMAYLPAAGPAGPLDTNLLDPTTTLSGVFGGDVVGLKLDVDFSHAGLLGSSIDLGSLVLCGLTQDTDLNGQTVAQLLAVENTALGGGTTTDSIADLDTLAEDAELAFLSGSPNTFSQDHLQPVGCR